MQQVLLVIVVLLIMIFMFVPTVFLDTVNNDTHTTKQALNLSAKVLGNCIEASKENYTEIAKSFKRNQLTPIEINKEKLLNEFYEMLYKNCSNEAQFNLVKSRLLIKVVVAYDKFFITDNSDNWSPPYYFTASMGNDSVYLNTQNDVATYYDTSGVMKYDRTIAYYGIDQERKNDIIIDRINAVVSQYTSEKAVRDKGLRIEIKNPARNDSEYKVNMSYFNVLHGVTFFVVYAENRGIAVNSRDIKYKSYNVVGYTLD